MPHLRSIRRALLLTLSLLSACAASDAATESGTTNSGRRYQFRPTGAYGNYLAGRFAMANADVDTAATDLLAALAANPRNPELLNQTFVATLQAGRPEAATLARQLGENPVAQLLLANVDAKADRWKSAEARYRSQPRQAPTQLLQPLLIAWAQQGDGRTDDALTTLRPLVETPRLRGLYALHSAIIADIANRKEDAARLYDIARSELAEPNLRVGAILASWYARNGQPVEAQRILGAVSGQTLDAPIVLPALLASSSRRPVSRATEGLAESYLAFGSGLRAQNVAELASVILRLSLDLRSDLTPARMIAAELLISQQQPRAALRILAPIGDSDPLSGMVRLRRSALLQRLDRTEEAQRVLRQLAADFPNSPLPALHLGDMLRSKSQYREAIAEYDQALSRIPRPGGTDWIIFYHRGIARDRDSQWEAAEADFEEALKLAPEQPFVLNYLGYSWADRGHNLEHAREMIERAAQRRPNDGAITDSLGWVQFRLGRVNEAVKLLERAVELEPDDPTINGHLGDAYWAVGRKIEAQYQWRRAITLNPPPDDLAKLEAKLAPEYTGPTARAP